MRRVALLAIINVTLFAVVFALAEGGVRLLRERRLTESSYSLPICEPHSTRIWQYKAGWSGRHASKEYNISIRTNRLRLRGPEPSLSPARIRILVIGDS